MIREEVNVIANKKHTNDIHEIILKKPKEFGYQPGQFVNLKITKEGHSRMRAYSLLSHPEEKNLRILIKNVKEGFASPAICEKKVNDKILLIGPFGRFNIDTASKIHKFYSAGTGLAPFIPMIRELSKDSSNKITLITGHRTSADIPCIDELNKLSLSNQNFEWIASLTREKNTKKWLKGRVHEHIKDADLEGTHYICGLKELIFDTEKKLFEKGVKKENIKFERFN